MKSERVTQFKGEERAIKKPDPGEWFQMAHKITEALYSTKELDKTQIKLLLYIVHKTWGSMGRKSFIFVTNAAARSTNIDKAQLIRARDSLIAANIILKADKDGHELMVNKYPETWDVSVLQKFRSDTTERRKQMGGDVSTPPGGGDVSTPSVVTYPHPPGDVSTPPTGPRSAQSHDRGYPIDKYIDKSIDNPLYPPTGDRVCYPPDYRFDEFWAAYPRKTARKKAAEKWASLTKRKDFGDDLVDRILGAIRTHKQTDQWKRKVIPHPATWLNQERWSDEIETASASNPFDLSRLTGE